MNVIPTQRLNIRLAAIVVALGLAWAIPTISAAGYAKHHMRGELAWVKKALKIPPHQRRIMQTSAMS